MTPPPGRRERNKQEKLERIVAAASTLFAEHGVDEVTTQQIAEAADIGTGTLFLYAKTKGELLLLVQNSHYESSLARGREAAETAQNAVDALLALLTPVVECNRVHVGNGRVYLREMLFGDPEVPGHAAALAIIQQTGQAMTELIGRHTAADPEQAARQAQVISAAMYVTMAASPPQAEVSEVVTALEGVIRTVLAA